MFADYVIIAQTYKVHIIGLPVVVECRPELGKITSLSCG